ncbi:hypothetical protein [Variovorax sp. PAMC26660]|uniref:phage tail tip fiber protein n=1 Tax=Variovorax sp. PAMC26660 TaxID=2762322 RepID=UPI00164E2709|nr:hypothetical protein [Variovorax sp. PAMC26660]QNK66092.1 hypothetical protein H7F35_23210 [Variovorax sp. PAMC26660]
MATDKRKDLPQPSTPNFDQRLREAIMNMLGRQGDKLDRAVTVRDLVDAGVVHLNPNWNGGLTPPIAGPGAGTGGGSAPPPIPTGFDLAGGISNVFISHDEPKYRTGGGHRRTLVFGIVVAPGDPLPTFDKALPLTEFSGTVFAYPSAPATTWRMWIKWQSAAGQTSLPAGGVNGLEVRTGEDVRKLIDALTGAAEDPNSPYSKFAIRADLFYIASEAGPTNAGLFSVVTTPITNNGVTVPVGVYMANAFIMNGTITNAKIGNAAIDDAKIANLSASKIKAGAIAVGEYVQSTGFVSGTNGVGWRIDGLGTIEASNAIIRGAIHATSGMIGGIVITNSYIASPNFDGTNGFYLGANGQLVLPSGTVTTAKLAAGAVTADKINVTNLGAVSAEIGFLISRWPDGGWVERDGNGERVYGPGGNLLVRVGRW